MYIQVIIKCYKLFILSILLTAICLFSKDLNQKSPKLPTEEYQFIVDTLFLLQINKNNGYRIKTEKHDSWNINTWNNLWKHSYKYNDSLVEKFDSTWVPNDENWKCFAYNSYILQPKGKIFEKINYLWDNQKNKWVKDLRLINSYDKWGSFNGSEGYSWNLDNSNWILDKKSKTTNLYNQNGKIIESTSEIWDFQINSWSENKSKLVYTLNSMNLLEGLIWYTWKIENPKWQPNSRNNRTYDFNKNLFECTYTAWDKQNEEWVSNPYVSYKFINSYDSLSNLDEILIQKLFGAVYLNHIRIKIIYEKITNPLINSFKKQACKHYDIVEKNNKIFIKNLSTKSKIEIFNLHGRLIYNTITPPQSTLKIDRSLIPNGGIFVIKLLSSYKVAYEKVLLR